MTPATFGPIQMAHRACTGARLTCGTSQPGIAGSFEGTGLAVVVRGAPRAPAHVTVIRGTLDLIFQSAFPQGGGVKQAMLPLPGRRAMDVCELLAGGSSERPCPVR